MHDLGRRRRHGAVAARGLSSSGSTLALAPREDCAALARMVGNRAFCRLVQRAPIAPPNRQLPAGPQLPADAQMVDLDKIEYTQPGISFSTKNRDTGESQSVGKMAAQMKKTGWDVSQPADIVKLSDGRLVSLDHRRMWAADRAGLKQVSARVRGETQALDAATAKRFAIDGKAVPTGTNPVTNQPWKAGDRPKTWGDAMRFRSAVQGFGKAGQQGKIGYNPDVLPGGAGVRDSNFPATGSKDMPMRVQPGPFNRDEPYTGGGTVTKGGGKRTTVPSGRVVQGTTGGGGTPEPAGGGGTQEPSVVVDPALRTGGRRRGQRGRRGAADVHDGPADHGCGGLRRHGRERDRQLGHQPPQRARHQGQAAEQRDHAPGRADEQPGSGVPHRVPLHRRGGLR